MNSTPACNGVEELVRNKVPELMIDIVNSEMKSEEIHEQAVWCIGNMAGENEEIKAKFIPTGILARIC